MVKKLTPKQEKFVQEYLTNGHNGTAAALAAGYSENNAAVQATQLLRKPLIAEKINEVRETEQEEFNFSRQDFFDLLMRMVTGEETETETTTGFTPKGAINTTKEKSLKKDGAQMLAKFFGFEAPTKIEQTGSFDIEVSHDFSNLSTDQIKEILGKK